MFLILTLQKTKYTILILQTWIVYIIFSVCLRVLQPQTMERFCIYHGLSGVIPIINVTWLALIILFIVAVGQFSVA